LHVPSFLISVCLVILGMCGGWTDQID
jgi:hypothetical protein